MKKKQPPQQRPPAVASVAPIAISYIRFSTPEQRKGDSLRRQTEATAAWCEKNGVALDETLSSVDAGRSGYHGRHRSDKAALGRFLELVKEGKVPRGSFLVIENLDRLSREDERTALRLWLDILDAGINIVQLTPETLFRHERSDMVDVMRAIIELSRGHSESNMKSVRSLANWDAAVSRARQGQEMKPRRKDGTRTKAITSRLPGWLRLTNEGVVAVIPERAAVVWRIFELARSGLGANAIVKKLIAEEVPAFGGREATDDGRTKAIAGDLYACGEWRTSYVRSILSDRRALGEYQPRDADEKAKGPPVPGYYPRVVTDDQFHAARAAVLGRKNPPGRVGDKVANLFGGLMRNARDGSTYYAACRSEYGAIYRVLLNKTAIESDSRAYTFPYATFEAAVLSMLREIDPREIDPATPPDETTVLAEELKYVRQRRAQLALALLDGEVAEVAAAIRQLAEREAELKGRIDLADQAVAVPRQDSWRDAQSLAAVLDNMPEAELEDARLRLRAALRRVIESVWLLVVPRGRKRLCAVQLHFSAGGGKCRSYLILNSPGHAGGTSKPRGARWWARSLPDAAGLDLRDRSHADALATRLEALDLDEFVGSCLEASS